MAAGTADTEHPGRAGRAPHPPRTGGAARRDRRLRPGPPQAGAGDPERERWSITLRFTFLTVIPSELVVYNPMGILITYLQADRALVTEAAAGDRASRRDGRAALEPFGWTGRQAEWIALVCLHSGVFTRAQLSAYLRIDRWQALRFVRAMSERRLAADETLEGRKVCRICGREIYRALGAEDLRHRRTASDEVLLRRLLSLDYVLEHTGLSWLPDRAGEGRRVRGARHRAPDPALAALPGSRRQHPALFPAQAAGRAGRRARRVRLRRSRTRYHDGATLVGRSAHRGLWKALGERVPIRRGRGRRPHREGAAAGPDDPRELDQHIYSIRPLRRSGTRQCGPPRDRPNRAGHPQAKDDRVLKEYGDLQACLKRIVELNDLHRSSTPGTMIHGFATWRSRRLPGGGF